MKKLLLGTVGLAALGMIGPAFAADLAPRPYTKAPPVPYVAPVANWTGFYIGGFGGYGWSDRVRVGFPGGPSATFSTDDLSGGFGGGTIGYNWQAPGSQFVWGIEVDAAGADLQASARDGLFVARDKINAFGSVTGRIGVTLTPSTLLYAKGGYAWANNKVSLSDGFTTISESRTHSGWTVGAGLEYMFAPNWSGKVEYMYADFGNQTFGRTLLTPGIELGTTIHTIKAGVNYHFNWNTVPAPGF
jgi:outer membrane immunogenic protein